jgi:hypothetical protein
VVSKRRPALLRRDLAQAVGEKAQRPLGGDGRVELAHRTGGGIARVDEGLAARSRWRSFSASKSSRRM